MGFKIDQKSIKIEIKISLHEKQKTFKTIDFWFLKPWPLQDEMKFDQKSLKNQSQNAWYFNAKFDGFFVNFGAQVGSKIQEKSIKNQ